MKIKRLTAKELSEQKFYNNLTKSSREYWGCQTPMGVYRMKMRSELIKKYIKIKSGAVILDLGCGLGNLIKYFTNTKAKIYGIDISPKSIAYSKRSVRSKNIIFQVQSAHSLKFRGNYFDAVIGNGILHHIDLKKALPEILRVLKPGGKIFFSEPNLINPEIYLERKIPFLRKLVGNSPNETAFTRWQIKKILEKFKFTNIEVRPFDFLYPALPVALSEPLRHISKILEKTPLIKEFSGSMIIKAQKSL